MRLVLAIGLVALAAVYVACLGFGVQTTGDYGPDFAPAMGALLSGHLHAFFANLPVDGAGGSLLLRAPAGLVVKALGAALCVAAVLLALAFLLRCIVDPSNHVHYHVPLIVAIAAYEARMRSAPVPALLATGLAWLVFHTISGVASLNVQFAAYMAVALAVGGALVAELLPRRDWLGRAAIVRHP